MDQIICFYLFCYHPSPLHAGELKKRTSRFFPPAPPPAPPPLSGSLSVSLSLSLSLLSLSLSLSSIRFFVPRLHRTSCCARASTLTSSTYARSKKWVRPGTDSPEPVSPGSRAPFQPFLACLEFSFFPLPWHLLLVLYPSVHAVGGRLNL
jgi:hypothetical protein